MPPISRDAVIAAVDLYGRCWTEQDPSLLSQLFTTDAIYSERIFDSRATFRGLEAIQEYWRYQIVGKQSNIAFRHVVDEMVRDSGRKIAVVKWMAELDNRRENRAGAASDKTYKRVRFCQMAKLVFDEDSGKICQLEEYAQACSGPGVKWPENFADANAVSDADLWSRMRQDPIVPRAPTQKILCSHCGSSFPSKSQLFKHLRSLEEQDAAVWVCFSVGYIDSTHVSSKFQNGLSSLPEEAAVEMGSLTWAVPLDFTGSAVVNVASVKMSRRYVDGASVKGLRILLNGQLRGEGGSVHTAAIMDRPCIQERREFELYEAFVPWAILQGQDDYLASTVSPPNCGGWSSVVGHRRQRLEDTRAAECCDRNFANLLRDGARLLKDGGCIGVGHFAREDEGEMKIRIRSSTMREPFHSICRISVSMRQPKAGYVEVIVGLLVAYGQSLLNDEELIARARHLLEGGDEVEPQMQITFPTLLLCLLEPSLTKYEGKAAGVSLCTSSAGVSDSMRKSFDFLECAIIKKVEENLDELRRWVERLGEIKCR